MATQTESSTVPMPKAAPVGARLDSALAGQTRAKIAVEAADKMLTIAQLRMKETMTEMEQANIAVEVAMLLELQRPHLDFLLTQRT